MSEQNSILNEIGSLEGDRGLPSVNNEKSNAWKKGLFKIFFFAGILVTALFAYSSYKKSQAVNAEAVAPKPMQINHSVPTRTFDTISELEQKTTGVNPKQASSSQPIPTTDSNPQFETILVDKSSGELLITKDGHQANDANNPNNDSAQTSSLGNLLKSTPTPVHSATILKHRNYVLAKGSFIDCVLQTKLNTTVPGMTSCVVTRNIYSDTGKVLLIERGSTVSGEYQSGMQQGQARIFVLWNRIKTPNGVVINLDSPGTDSLGGSGVPGYVDNHFFQRFGAAIMLSFVQDFAAAAANQIDRSGTTITLNNSTDATQSLATEALRNTINIPPTLYKNQGERIGIFVARDLDFRSVYDLKSE